MEKQSHNKFKIKYILLSILFMILFIFTALNISIPLTAYADTTTTIGQTMYENGEFGDGLTIDENGDIIIE